MSLEERIDKLQQETTALDQKIVTSRDYSSYFFLGALATPFVIFIIIYNTKYAIENGEKSRKKVLKLTLLLTAIVWGSLYGANWYLTK
jgi:hypothetical protein